MLIITTENRIYSLNVAAEPFNPEYCLVLSENTHGIYQWENLVNRYELALEVDNGAEVSAILREGRELSGMVADIRNHAEDAEADAIRELEERALVMVDGEAYRVTVGPAGDLIGIPCSMFDYYCEESSEWME